LPITNSSLFFHDRIVAIADEAGAHRFGVFPLGIGSDLNANELVDGGIAGGEGGYCFFFKASNERVGIFLPVTAATCT